MFPLKSILLLLTVHIGLISSFDLGVQYIYDHKTDITAGVLTYRTAAELLLTPVWENSHHEKLIKFEIRNLSFVYPEKLQSKVWALDLYKLSPFYVHVIKGKVTKYFSDSSDEIAAKNIKKALASILQYQTQPQETEEEDVCGTCKVSYRKSEAGIEKSRTDCVMQHQESSLLHPNEALGITLLQTSYAFYELLPKRNDIIQKFTAKDVIRMASNLWADKYLTIESNMEMVLKDTIGSAQTISGNLSAAIDGLQRIHQGSFTEESLKTAILSSEQTWAGDELVKKVSNLKKYLDTSNLATTSSATAFLKLVKIFRHASKDAIKKVLKNSGFRSIYPQLLDVTAFSATPASVEAAFETLDFSKHNADHLERYLQSMALIPHSKKYMVIEILTALKKRVNSEKIKASLIVTLGSLAKRIQSNEERKEVQEMTKEYLENGFHSCKSDSCRMQYLRGFRNAELEPSIDFLIGVAVNGGQLALEALLALAALRIQRFPLKCEKLAKNVYYELKAKQESSSRILAADLLIECHTSEGTLRDYLVSLGSQTDHELSSALLSRLIRLMENNNKLRSEVQRYIKDEENSKFYSTFVQHEGSSSVCVEKELMRTSGTNSSYSIFMEMLPGGLLKRSSFDVKIDTNNGKLPILSVGMFAAGLGSLAGATEETSEETKAGMELTLLGVSLRPYVFFEGTSELMGHVWSRTASEPTPALQGNVLITDVNEVRIFQNGLPVWITMNGAMSADLSAFIQISIWDRSSHSEVQNKVALQMLGSLKLKHPLEMENSLTFRGSSSIDFITDSEFYEMPFKMCLRMSQPEFVFRNEEKSHLLLEKSKFARKKSKTKKILVPAKSFHMYKKNNEVCKAMLD